MAEENDQEATKEVEVTLSELSEATDPGPALKELLRSGVKVTIKHEDD